MRFLKRLWRRVWGDFRILKRRREIEGGLEKHFGLPRGALRLKSTGARGNDNIYLVMHGERTRGVLRLCNPYRERSPLPVDYPFLLQETPQRIAREWAAYALAAPQGLAPKPLWRTEDALLNEYLPGETLQAQLERNPAEAWNILSRAARRLRELHALGQTHMDVCLANMRAAPEGNIVFVDYEYAPAAKISAAAQRVYDHLRLVESTWKFIPDEKKGEYNSWLQEFSAGLDDSMRRVDLSVLEPALGRVLSAPGLGAAIRKIFASSTVTCKACGAPMNPAISLGKKNGFEMVPCARCGTVMAHPFPTAEELQAFYQAYHGSVMYKQKKDSKIRRSRKRIQRLLGLTQGRRFLDVGCNCGFAVKAALDLGLDAYGIDIDVDTVKASQDMFGAAHFGVAPVQDCARTGRKADILYTSEVIEHVPDPDGFVAALHSILDKDGVLYLTTPDRGHWAVPKDFTEWSACKPPFHITYFTKSGIERLLARHGLRVEKSWFSLKPSIRLIARKA